MTFLDKIIAALLAESSDLSKFSLVLPGKRPIVFIKKILVERQYSGFLPDFFTAEELAQNIADVQELKGIPLWLFAFEIYSKIFGDEDFSSFLKWFPTVQKDWDDILKFTPEPAKVLAYMLDEERIKNWGERLGEDENSPRRRNLDFWRKMNIFLPKLNEELRSRGWASSGMISEITRENIPKFTEDTDRYWVFCGFNAFTMTEEMLVRSLLQHGKARCFFHADRYYLEDGRQEAGKFLRQHRSWKEFNESRPFEWISDDFAKPKEISVFEVSGNISQTKVLPGILSEISPEDGLSDTAVVLLDENLLPASLDALGRQAAINITMGFPLKNLAFSNAVKKLFYIQKQLAKRDGSYYYSDLLAVLESVPNNESDQKTVKDFELIIHQRNIVYISKSRFNELLGNLSYAKLFQKPSSVNEYLDALIAFCRDLKNNDLDDIQYENISHFEKSFNIIKNQLSDYRFEVNMETLEVLINHLVNSETIDFEGEPLQGLQIMGLLETRLLNFKNVILLSVNEGKLPLGNSQNTYLPFDVRRNFGLHTFLENDGIYAYHFYRLLQGAERVFLLYNGLSSGVNTGEKSRFIAQLEMESGHNIKQFIIENTSEPIADEPMVIPKTGAVLAQLEYWKSRVSATHLTTYLFDPVQFYFNYVLRTGHANEIEEELSQLNYGNIVHYALQFIYEKHKGKTLETNDLKHGISLIPEAIDYALERLKHPPELYERGMNFIHKALAARVVESVLKYDLALLEAGHILEIIDIERQISGVSLKIDEDSEVHFVGFIDRIDRLDGQIRVIDYKTAKAKNLVLKMKGKEDTLLMNEEFKQALQLCIYLYFMRNAQEFRGESVLAGIWSFAAANSGVQYLSFDGGDLETAMLSIKNLILEILDPEIPFAEKVRQSFDY